MEYNKETFEQQFAELNEYSIEKYYLLKDHYASDDFIDYEMYDCLEENIEDELLYLKDNLSRIQ